MSLGTPLVLRNGWSKMAPKASSDDPSVPKVRPDHQKASWSLKSTLIGMLISSLMEMARRLLNKCLSAPKVCESQLDRWLDWLQNLIKR